MDDYLAQRLLSLERQVQRLHDAVLTVQAQAAQAAQATYQVGGAAGGSGGGGSIFSGTTSGSIGAGGSGGVGVSGAGSITAANPFSSSIASGKTVVVYFDGASYLIIAADC